MSFFSNLCIKVMVNFLVIRMAYKGVEPSGHLEHLYALQYGYLKTERQLKECRDQEAQQAWVELQAAKDEASRENRRLRETIRGVKEFIDERNDIDKRNDMSPEEQLLRVRELIDEGLVPTVNK